MRHRLRVRAVALRAIAHGLPDLVLGGSMCERVGREPLALASAQIRGSRVRRGPESGRARTPAPFLDARDGDCRLRAGGDEHGHVENPVLLRARQLLAVVEEHVAVERIVDGELRH